MPSPFSLSSPRAFALCGLLLLLMPTTTLSAQTDPLANQRQTMVDSQIRSRGVRQPSVLRAMAQVPRHLFVPEPFRAQAYADYPLPIGDSQTI